MPAWPGGPCPECGEEMPARLIHCFNCRALLNTDLEPDSVEIPEFVPLKEIGPVDEIKVRGHYVNCPNCTRELRVNAKYIGKSVTCKQCDGRFTLILDDPKVEQVGVYVYCPHCSVRLRMATKYVGIKVACKTCKGHLMVVP
jgi:ssDNA-binding Zn-finger/Zn-ribbon topoisomerase 1